MRPSLASTYLLAGEIEPEAYPDFAVAEFRRECLHEYRRRQRSIGRSALARRVLYGVLTMALESTTAALLFNERLRQEPGAFREPPLIAFLRALG